VYWVKSLISTLRLLANCVMALGSTQTTGLRIIFWAEPMSKKEDCRSAIAEFQRAVELEKDNAENWANLGHAYAQSGKRAEAQKIIDHLKESSAHAYVAPIQHRSHLCRLGRKGPGLRLA